MTIEYRYFAHVTQTRPSTDDPAIVCRQWTDHDGVTHEEHYTADLRWARGCTVHHVRSGRLDGEIHPVTEELARRFEEIQAARVRGYEPADGQYSYSVVVTNLHPVDSPRALLRTWRSPQGYSMEQSWTATAGWLTSNYKYEIDFDHLDGELVGISEEDVVRYQDLYRSYPR